MRFFDGSEQQQRRDPHTFRAQRARGRCAIVDLKPRMVSPWRFSKKITGFVTSRSESSLNLPHFRYHSIVAPCSSARVTSITARNTPDVDNHALARAMDGLTV